MSDNRWIPTCVVAVTAVLMLASPRARAELPFRLVGASARALGMGDAVTALGLGTAGLYFNPACMSQIRQYSIDAGYGYQSPSAAHNLHISFVDSQTNPEFAMGAGYTLTKSRRKINGVHEGFTVHDVRAAVSGSFGTEGFQFSIGGTFRYLNISGDELTSPYSESIRAGRDPATLTPGEMAQMNARKADPRSMSTFDVGILMNISDLVYIGAVGQNLVTWSRHWAPRRLGVGLGFVYKMLDIGASVDVNFDSRESVKASPSFGIEYVAGGAVAIRAGFDWDRVSYPQQYRVSGGLGYISQYVGIDVGYAHDVAHKENWLIEASIRAFLP
ncbi:MAG: hypothetical protein GXP54_07160 [Deltaproteobacteria bacterium]|nr:hypothetical protein [Deltaproteobacteria bacterium]